MLACCSEEADPSCSASTLSNEEYASLLDAAMRFPGKQVADQLPRPSKDPKGLADIGKWMCAADLVHTIHGAEQQSQAQMQQQGVTVETSRDMHDAALAAMIFSHLPPGRACILTAKSPVVSLAVCCRALKLCKVPAAVLHAFDDIRLKPASQVVLGLPEHILAAHAQPSPNPVQLQMTTPFPVTLPECALPADFKKQHGLLAKPHKHLVHRAVLAQHMGEFKSFSTSPFQLNRKGIAHSSRTWQNSEKHVYLFLGYCHHYQQVSQPTLQLFLSSPLIAQFVSFHTAAGHSQLYIRNFLSCAKCVLRWWQSKPGGNHPSFVAGLEWLQTLGLQVMHLMRCSGTVSLAAAACSMDVLRVWGRSEGVVGKSYLPKSPLSALPATGVLAGFGNNFMTNHAFGRGTVAVPVKWIDSLVPHARVILQAVRLRNRTRTGKADFSGQHCVESTLYLAETFWQSSPVMLQRYGLGWWALQLPTVCFIVGSSSFRQIEQQLDLIVPFVQVMNAELEWNTRPLSPQMTEAFDKISKQVCSLSEQIAHLQLSVNGMMQPVHSQTAADLSMPTASSSNTQARAATSPHVELEAQVGLSSGLSSVHEAVDEWFTGLHGFPAPPLLCEQAIQRGQRLSKKAIDNLSRRRHLPLRIQALATDRCWPLKKALAVYELVMQRHSLSLAELRDAVRLSSPVRHPDAKGGKPAQSQHVNRSPGLPLISISQFAAWVQKATDDIASMSVSW
ncbi:hypothetical protein ABBQ32_007176 [Trebouxia sp. C0010 RCD-2024]